MKEILRENFGGLVMATLFIICLILLVVYDLKTKELQTNQIIVTVSYADMQCTYSQSYEKVMQRIEKKISPRGINTK